MSLRIHNTLTRRLEPFAPIEPGHVRMYVCGITVYDLCHMGHARMILAFDVVYRWLLASGYRVTYVRNITDIEDKIIKRALERGMTHPRAHRRDDRAPCTATSPRSASLPPTHEPRATDYVPQMLDLIDRLEAKGLAYQAEGGDVNYAVRRFPGYGKLSGKSLDELRAGERVAVLGDKDDPLDFVLWKSAKADEPDDAKWPSRLGPGRPGWHIECSAMSCALLGEPFDIHGGGMDLQFPHHENEIAQSEGASGGTVRQHLDAQRLPQRRQREDVEVAGQLLHHPRRAAAGSTARRVRFFMLRTHYRSPFNFTEPLLEEARSALQAPVHGAASGGRRPALAPSTGPSRAPRPSRRRWTTTSTRPVPWRCCSSWRAK